MAEEKHDKREGIFALIAFCMAIGLLVIIIMAVRDTEDKLARPLANLCIKETTVTSIALTTDPESDTYPLSFTVEGSSDTFIFSYNTLYWPYKGDKLIKIQVNDLVDVCYQEMSPKDKPTYKLVATMKDYTLEKLAEGEK